MRINTTKSLFITGVFLVLLVTGINAAKAGEVLSNYSWSDLNTPHEERRMQFKHWRTCLLSNCSENKWYLGANIKEDGFSIYTPGLEHIIKGVDLGISIQIPQGHTIMYMGDTWGYPSPEGCLYPGKCNDAITRIVDTDGPQNGVDARILVDDQDPSKFRPLLVPAVNTEHPFGPSVDEDDFGKFNVPTGAAVGYTIGSPPFAHHTVYLWYTTAMTTNKAQSYLTCSEDGIYFSPCVAPDWYPVDPAPVIYFSSDRFINVSPIQFDHHWWNEIDGNGSCALCKLKPHLQTYVWFNYSPGMLLFGAAGGPQEWDGQEGGYRKSPLYLAYMELQSLKVWYYTGDDWSRSEGDVVPIISPVGQDQEKPFLFGELSVQLVEGDDFDDSYLVMLSNHELRRVYYRTASLVEPENWSPPQMTCAVGYGPYIMHEFTEIKEGNPDRLILYHTISAWNGDQLPQYQEPYGVFTTKLRLMQHIVLRNFDDYVCTNLAPAWPPQP